MRGFTKLFSSIIHSTVWREDMHVKVVWITMLAMAESRGQVSASIPGLADAARVTIPQVEDALARLAAPDAYSRTKDHDGRRIEKIDGGWRLLNHGKYRDGRDPEERRRQNREAARRFRAKHSVSERNHASAAVSSHHQASSGVIKADDYVLFRGDEQNIGGKEHTFDLGPGENKPQISHSKPGSAQAEAEADTDTEEKKPLNTIVRPTSARTINSRFQAWYSTYPRHEARAAAEKAWTRLSEEDQQECMKMTPLWTQAHREGGTEPQFIPLPATYLNGKRWQDDCAAIARKGAKPKTGDQLAGAGRDFSYLDRDEGGK